MADITPRIAWQNFVHFTNTGLEASAQQASMPIGLLRDQMRSMRWRTPLGWNFKHNFNSAICFEENSGNKMLGFIAEGNYTSGTVAATAVETAMDNAGLDPTGISSLKAWYRGDKGCDVDSSIVVVDWNDQSGTGGTLSKHASQNPSWMRNNLNNWPAVLLDTDSTYSFESDASDIFDDLFATTTGQGTIIAVVRFPGAQASSSRFIFSSDVSNSNALYLDASADNLIARSYDSGYKYASIDISTLYGEWIVICWMKDGTNVYVGAEDLDSAALQSTACGSGGSPSGALRLGEESGDTDDHFYLAEIMFFNAALSEANRQGLVQYLKQKYGSTVGTDTTEALPNDEYTATYGTDYKFSVANGTGNFELNWSTGSYAHVQCGVDLGFNISADDTGAASFTSDEVAHQSRVWTTSIFNQSQSVRCCILLDHSAGASGGVFTIEANDVNHWEPTYLGVNEELDTKSEELRLKYFSTDKTYKCWRLIIDDVQNPIGYSELGIWYLGTYTEPTRKYESGLSEDAEQHSDSSFSDHGAPWHDEKPQRRLWSVEWRLLDTSDKALWITIRNYVKNSRAFFVSLDPLNDATRTYYVRLPRGVSGPHHIPKTKNLWAIRTEFVEELG